MNWKRLGLIVLGIMVLMAVSDEPQKAAAGAKNIANAAKNIADGLADFITTLAS